MRLDGQRLLEGMLEKDPKKRMKLEECLEDDFMVRKQEAKTRKQSFQLQDGDLTI